jgi:hypothetical protein
MKIIYREGMAFTLGLRRKPTEPATPLASQADYQGLRYSRYGIRYTQ